MSGGEALILCGSMIALVIIIITKAHESAWEKDQYHKGWCDRQKLADACEMSPDDEALLKEMKKALKNYVRATCLYKKGDSSRIDKVADWREYKDIAWELTVRRKELR